MRLFATAAVTLLILMSTGIVSVASAWQPEIEQTQCDTLSTDPLLVRIEFTVHNPDPPPVAVCRLRLFLPQTVSSDQDTCEVAACESPPEWVCAWDPTPRHAIWEVTSGTDPDCIESGETRTFAIEVTDPTSCCYHAWFYGSLPDPFFRTTVCFACDEPVQALSSTWGELKAIYR